MTKELTSASLLDRIKLGPGNQSWFEFVDLYKQLIEGWLRSQGLSANEAEDIRQEVMTVLIKEIPNFEHNGRPGAFRSWLRKITVNRMREHWRKNKREKAPQGVDLEALAVQLEDDTSELSNIWNVEHQQHVLNHLLQRISKQFHAKSFDAFRQVVVQQRPIEQVSRDLDISINAIRIAQSRILQALRKAGEGLIEVT